MGKHILTKKREKIKISDKKLNKHKINTFFNITDKPANIQQKCYKNDKYFCKNIFPTFRIGICFQIQTIFIDKLSLLRLYLSYSVVRWDRQNSSENTYVYVKSYTHTVSLYTIVHIYYVIQNQKL